jgi:uncharacterized protein (TIGR02145 family)
MKKNRIIFNAVLMGAILLTSCSNGGLNESNNSDEVTIGKQVWMVKNLNVDKFRNGDPIPQAKTNAEWVSAGENKQPAWCYYDNDTANGAKYGKLYNWYAVNEPRGLAPKGWHIPTDAEWTTLRKFLAEGADNKMKSTSGWNVNAMNVGNGSNSSGFSGLPGGGRSGEGGTFYNVGDYGYWWSSTEYGTYGAWHLELHNTGAGNLHNASEAKGFSVRCLRD